MSSKEWIVSVIVPAHNAEHCLEECLDSVVSQSIQSWEAIVVDDGSTDDTERVARAYARYGVRYLKQNNQGQGAARNRGMEQANGEYIAFLDADDGWRHEFLEKTVAFLSAHPDAIAVSTAFIIRYANGREVVGPACVASDHGMQEERVLDRFYDFWADHDHVRTGTALIRRTVIHQAGPQRADLRISQDLEYFGYLATFGKWGFMPEPLLVDNSRAATARSGWRRKYKKRRRLCPTVEAWQSRILTRLSDRDRRGFEVVRGRVALGYAHSMILGGMPEKALHIVREFGDAMPENLLVRIMRASARMGALSWVLACQLIKIKEWLKSTRMSLVARWSRGQTESGFSE